LGGAALGTVLGYIASKITAQVDEPQIEITLTTILAYGSYLLAEHLHVSGVIATVAAGLTVGNYGALYGMSPRTRVALWSFWEYIAFVINSMVFLLIGIEVHIVEMLANWKVIAGATVAVLLGRILTVYCLTPLSDRFSERIPMSWQHVMVWGGLHGSVSIALALSLPRDFPDRDLLLTMTFGVAAFSIVVQGLSMSSLLAWLGLAEHGETEYASLKAKQLALAAAQTELDNLRDQRALALGVYSELGRELQQRSSEVAEELSGLLKSQPGLVSEEAQQARRSLVNAERVALQRAVISGVIPAQVGEELLSDASRELEKLSARKEQD
jgi:CPA1 family monovalent cation:H+ antiporter